MARQILQVQVTGLPELKAALATLFPEAISERAVVAALKTVARPVVADARRIVGTGKGIESKRASQRARGRRYHIRDSIRAVQTRQRVGGGNARRYVKIGGSVTVGAFHPLAHLKEYGTAPRYQKGGRFTGHMPAQPFMRPAWERNRATVFTDLAPLVWKEIARAARRLSRRASKASGGG